MNLKDVINKVKDNKVYINGWKKMKRFSVIIPLMELDGVICVLFEVRSKKLKSQPGDICFPGGRIEKNETPMEAGLRELKEELGIQNIEIVNELDTVVRYDGIIIHPYLGIIKNKEELKISKDEVDHIFYVPLNYLLENAPLEVSNRINIERGKDFPYDLIVNGDKYKFREAITRSLFYKYKSYNIWGITAEILYDFLEKL